MAQSVDLSSVDAFFDVSTSLKSGNAVSTDQWQQFDSSTCYKTYADMDNQFIIRTFKESISLVFDDRRTSELDSLLSAVQSAGGSDRALFMKGLIVDNYLKVKAHYDDIRAFRNSYDFEALRTKSIHKLASFLGHSDDLLTNLKSLHFFVADADAADRDHAIVADFNLIFQMSDQERVELLAHEYFHNYRYRFEDHSFNHRCDMNYLIDMIQNEGIADLIDKSVGYRSHFTKAIFEPGMAEAMIALYDSAENDVERLNDLIVSYSRNQISEDTMVDGLIDIVRFNGHPMGFFMANQIVRAGYEKELVETFYKPEEFYKLYNLAAEKYGLFRFSDVFMNFVFHNSSSE